MNFTGAIIALSIIAGILVMVKLAKVARRNKQKTNDPYKGFHLGEMTHHDLPRSRYAERTSNQRWAGRSEKGGTKNEKDKSKNED